MVFDFTYAQVETMLPSDFKDNSTFSPAEQEAIQRARRKPRQEIITEGFFTPVGVVVFQFLLIELHIIQRRQSL